MRTRLAIVTAVLCAGLVLRTSSAHADTWPPLSAVPQVQADGSKDAAVVVGVDEYAFVPHVDGAAANARDWFTFLVQSEKVPLGHVHLLLNRDGTREQILDAAKRASQEVQAGGRLWVVFIGHGAPASDGNDGVLVGVDAQQTVRGLYARSLAQRELLGAVSGGAQATTFLVVDACFSGRTGSGDPIAPGLQPLVRVKESAPPKLRGSETAILWPAQ